LAIVLFVVVFAIAIFTKVSNPMPTLRSLQSLGLSGISLHASLYVLIAIEIVMCVWAILLFDSRWFRWPASMLLTAFTLFLSYKVIGTSNTPCGCMGNAVSGLLGAYENHVGIARNILLITMIWTPTWLFQKRHLSPIS
jgi:hypothetical protein